MLFFRQTTTVRDRRGAAAGGYDRSRLASAGNGSEIPGTCFLFFAQRQRGEAVECGGRLRVRNQRWLWFGVAVLVVVAPTKQLQTNVDSNCSIFKLRLCFQRVVVLLGNVTKNRR